MTLDVEERNFDSIIIDEILPFITKSRSRFVITDDLV
jgi:hypothetical protein